MHMKSTEVVRVSKRYLSIIVILGYISMLTKTAWKRLSISHWSRKLFTKRQKWESNILFNLGSRNRMWWIIPIQMKTEKCRLCAQWYSDNNQQVRNHNLRNAILSPSNKIKLRDHSRNKVRPLCSVLMLRVNFLF